MKKALSLVLVLVMVMSLAVSASASGNTVSDISKATTMTLGGETRVPVIALTVPAAAKVIVNPYQMQLLITGEDVAADTDEDDKVDDKLFSAPMAILSESDIALDVTATITGKAATGVTFATKPIVETDTANSVYAWISFKEIGDTEVADDTTIPTALAALTFDTEPIAIDKTTKVSAAPLMGTTAVTAKVGTLAKPTAEDGKTKVTGLAFKVCGDVNVGEKLANPWTSKMSVGATIAFTFMPDATAGG